MNKVIIFGDHLSYVTTILLKATLKEIEKLEGTEVIAVCDTSRRDPKRSSNKAIRKITAIFIKWLFNQEHRFSLEKNKLLDLYEVSRACGIKVIVPNGRDINHPEFIQLLKNELKPNICLSYFCPQIFKKELLEVFDWTANYHNSLLPKYGGIGATPWSLYMGESESGFTFHLINERVDKGDILYQEVIPVTSEVSPAALEYEKTNRAADAITVLLEMMRNRNKGQSQSGIGSYYGWKKFKEITTVEDPSACNFSELEKRLSIFNVLSIKIKDRIYHVTKLKKMNSVNTNKSHDRGLFFKTADNILVKPIRFLYMPLPLYSLYRFMTNR